MNLIDFYQVVKRHLALLFIFILVMVGVSYFYSVNQKTKFESYVSFYVAPVPGVTDQYGGFYSIQADSLAMDNFVSRMKSQQVVSEIYQRAGISTSDIDLASLGKKLKIRALSSNDIELRFVRENESDARALINAAVEVTREQKQAILAKKDTSQRTADINADPTTRTLTTDLKLNLLLSLLAAIILGLILVYLVYYFSGSMDYFKKAKKILGPKFNYYLLPRTAQTYFTNNEQAIEKIKFLRESIISQNKGPKMIITVAGIGFGDTLALASNIAKSFTNIEKKVLLVDANLSEPIMRPDFDEKKKIGLAEFLAGEKKLSEVISDLSEKHLSLLSAGNTNKVSPDLLDQLTKSNLISEITSSADVIIFASANLPKYGDVLPLLGISTALVLQCVLGKFNLFEAKEVKQLFKTQPIKPEYVIVD